MVLDSIEREGYALRADYPERKGVQRGMEMIGWVLWMALRPGGHRSEPAPSPSLRSRVDLAKGAGGQGRNNKAGGRGEALSYDRGLNWAAEPVARLRREVL